jgi:hypothetical protein
MPSLYNITESAEIVTRVLCRLMHAGETNTLYDVPDCPDLIDTHHHHCNLCHLLSSISISTSAGNHTPSKLQKNESLNSLLAFTDITCYREKEALFTGNTSYATMQYLGFIKTLHAAEKEAPQLFTRTCPLIQE